MANGIDITRPQFPSAATAGAAPKADRPKAQLWINIGYEVEVETTDGAKETRFISTPMGMPVDTQEPVASNSSNKLFAAQQAAKNDLLKQLITAGMDLEPGTSKIVNLQVELRRVQAADANSLLNDPDVNPMIRKLGL